MDFQATRAGGLWYPRSTIRIRYPSDETLVLISTRSPGKLIELSENDERCLNFYIALIIDTTVNTHQNIKPIHITKIYCFAINS